VVVQEEHDPIAFAGGWTSRIAVHCPAVQFLEATQLGWMVECGIG